MLFAILNSKSNSGVANIKNTHAAQEFSAIQSSHNPLRSPIFAACCRSMQCRVGHHGVSELREHPIQSGPGPGRSTGLSGLRPGGRKPTSQTCWEPTQQKPSEEALALVAVTDDHRAGSGVVHGLSSCTTSEVFAESGAAARRSMASHITR